MCLSDMAEAWWKTPKTSFYSGPDFIHIPNSTCGHIKFCNNVTSEYLNDINCYDCLKLIKENGNIYNLKEGISRRQQSEIDREKHKFRFGKCDCGSPMTIRKNKSNNKEFLGCINYPTCKKTKSL